MLYFSIIALIIVISDGVKYIPDLFIPVDVSVWISAVDDVSEVVLDTGPDATSDGVPDATSDGVPDTGPDATSDCVPDTIDGVPECSLDCIIEYKKISFVPYTHVHRKLMYFEVRC